MTKILILTALFAALLASGCGEDDTRTFGRTDLNKDGKVIFEEAIIAYPDLTVEEFRAYDKDGGGALSGEEYEVFAAARASGAKPVAKAEPAAEPEAPAPAAPAAPAPVQAAPAVPADAPAAPATAIPADQAPPVAAPVVQEPAAPVVTQVEVASTVPAPEPQKKPAGPSEIAYTVQRGDSLNKIARKFKVDVKAIMARNKIDNPDKVAAGQVLDIPLREGAPGDGAGKAAPASGMEGFVEAFFARSGAASPDELLAMYADEVDFYKKGVVKKDFVREDKVRYFERWPGRSYTLAARPTVTPVQGANRTRIEAPVRYQVKNGERTGAGEALFVFEVINDGGTPRIVFEDSTVTARP